jgi:hypothetical protein
MPGTIPPTRGQIPRAAQLRVYGRVKEILARRAALERARTAARRADRAREQIDPEAPDRR